MISRHLVLAVITGCVAVSVSARPIQCPKRIKTTATGQLITSKQIKAVGFEASTLKPGNNKTYQLVDTWLTSFDDQTQSYTNLMCDYKNNNEPLSLGLHLSATGHFKHKNNDKNFADDIGQSFCTASKTCRVII